MIDGRALSSRAISDAGLRVLASEWSGPIGRANPAAVKVGRDAPRRTIVRRP